MYLGAILGGLLALLFLRRRNKATNFIEKQIINGLLLTFRYGVLPLLGKKHFKREVEKIDTYFKSGRKKLEYNGEFDCWFSKEEVEYDVVDVVQTPSINPDELECINPERLFVDCKQARECKNYTCPGSFAEPPKDELPVPPQPPPPEYEEESIWVPIKGVLNRITIPRYKRIRE